MDLILSAPTSYGFLIARFVDRLTQSLSLSKKCGVTVAGWSLGNIFTIAMSKVARGAEWVSSYYKHGDLKSRDFSQLDPQIGVIGVNTPFGLYIARLVLGALLTMLLGIWRKKDKASEIKIKPIPLAAANHLYVLFF